MKEQDIVLDKQILRRFRANQIVPPVSTILSKMRLIDFQVIGEDKDDVFFYQPMLLMIYDHWRYESNTHCHRVSFITN